MLCIVQSLCQKLQTQITKGPNNSFFWANFSIFIPMIKRVIVVILLIFSTFSFAQKNNDYRLAESFFRNGEYAKAEKLYQKLLTKNPFNTYYLSKLTHCFQQQQKFSEAEELLNDKLKSRPSVAVINVLLGYNFEQQQKITQAHNYYDKAIASIEKKSNYGTTIAAQFKKYNKLNYAIKAYEKLMKVKKNSNYAVEVAQIYGEKGDFEAMFNQFVNALDGDDTRLQNIKRFAATYVNDDAESENNILLKKALLRKSASNPKDVWNDMLSWLFTKQGDYGKALIQEKALFARNEDDVSGINQLGTVAFQNKDYDTARDCFEFIINNSDFEEDKINAIHMNLLVAIEAEEENIDDKFQRVFEANGINSSTLPIQMAYAKYLTFQEHKPNEAYEVLEKALQYADNSYTRARVKLRMGEVLVYQEKFNKALINFSQVQTRLKNHSLGQQARYKVAQTSYFKHDFEWAKAQLKVLKGSTSQLIANDAANLFLTISDNQPQDSVPTGLHKYAKANLFHLQKKNKEAIDLLNEIVTDYGGQDIEDEALFEQAKIYEEEKNFQEAVNNYNRILNLGSESIFIDDVHYNLAEIYNHDLKDTKKALEYYQKIIFDFPSSIYLVEARNKYRKLRGDSI